MNIEPMGIVTGLIGIANISGAVYLIKLVIAPLASTVKTLSESVKELYESRNGLEREVAEIRTIHRIRGCDSAGGKGKSD